MVCFQPPILLIGKVWVSVMHACACPMHTVRCSAADTHIKLLDSVVIGVSFLTRGVFECDLAQRRSVAVLCMLYKIRRTPMHPLYVALPEPYVPVLVTRGAVIAHRSIHLCGPSLQNLAVPHDFYSLCQYLTGTILLTLF